MNQQRPPSSGIPAQPGVNPGQQQGIQGHPQMQQMQPGMIRYSNVPGFPSHAGLQQQMPPISMQNSTFNSQNFRPGQVHPGYQMPPRTPQSIINQAQQAQQRGAPGSFVSASMGGQPIRAPHQTFQPGNQGPRNVPPYNAGGHNAFPRFTQPMPGQYNNQAGYNFPQGHTRPIFNQQFNQHQMANQAFIQQQRPQGHPGAQPGGPQQPQGPPQVMGQQPGQQQPGQQANQSGPTPGAPSQLNPEVTAWDPHRNYPNFQPQQPPPQTVVAPQHKPKRASCAIQIKDPETGQAIDPTSDDKPSSRTVSESQKDEVSEAAPPTVVATTVEEEKKITVEEKVQQEQASENVAVAENKQAAADDNDGWEVPKTKKGKGAKKTENAKGDKNNGKKNTREQSKEQPKKKEKEVEKKPKVVEEPKAAPLVVEAPVVAPVKVEEAAVAAPKEEVEEKPATPTAAPVTPPEPEVTVEPSPIVEEKKEEAKTPEPEAPKEENVESEEIEKKETESIEPISEEQGDGDGAKPEPVKEFESLALENRAKLEQGGKVAYDRDFLLKFQSACLMKPTELPELEVILSQPTEAHRRAPNHERENKNSFVPPFMKGSRDPRGGKHSKDHRRPSRQGGPGKVIKLQSMSQPIKLKETENKYVLGKNAKKDMDKADQVKEDFKRSAKAILNKLSPDNEHRLTTEFTSLQPNSYELLNIIVSTIFDKAIQEPGFSTLYARLCKTCHERWNAKYKFPFTDKNGKTKEKAFREVLLTKAQEKFEKLKILHVRDRSLFDEKSYEVKRINMEEEMAKMPKEGEEGFDKRKFLELTEELSDVNGRIKQQSMGNVTFVGELYLQKLLSSNIMNGCMRQLSTSDNENELESLSKLIPTIGREYEREFSQIQSGRPNQDAQKKADVIRNSFEGIFNNIHLIIAEKKTLGKEKVKVSPRIVCLLQDICDMKTRGWKKRGTSGPGLMKKDELAKFTERMQDKEKRSTEENYRDNIERRSRENLQRNRRINSGEWTASGSQPVLRPKFDPTSLAGRGGSNRGQSGGSGSSEVTLGPRRKNKQVTKFGSTDSESGHSSRTATPTNTMKNRFDLLDDDDLAEAATMTKSSSFNRRPSEVPKPPKFSGGQGRSMTHDGRVHVKKLSPEEATKKSRVIFNDFEETAGDVGKMEALCKDIEKYGLLESEDHQAILIDHLITSVIDKKDQDERLKMATFFHIMADQVKRLQFEKPLRKYVDKCVDEDYMTDFPRYWECLSMIIARLFKSRNVNPKMASKIFLKAGDEELGTMQLTKAYISLLRELSYVLPKADLHKFFSSSDIDLKDAMEKDMQQGTVADKLKEIYIRPYQCDMSYLLEELVIIDWPQIEVDLVKMLNEHDFTTDAAAEDFTKEYDYLESKVPDTPDGRGHIFFVRVIVSAVMQYSVEDDGNNVAMKKSGSDLALANCDLLLRKYTEREYAKMDTLFILAELFDRKYNNNQVVIKDTFVALYELEVIDESVFKAWMENRRAQNLENYAVIKASTTGFFAAMAEEQNGEQ